MNESCLLSVEGDVHGKKLRFMIDSGASSNFISFDLFRQLKLNFSS